MTKRHKKFIFYENGPGSIFFNSKTHEMYFKDSSFKKIVNVTNEQIEPLRKEVKTLLEVDGENYIHEELLILFIPKNKHEGFRERATIVRKLLINKLLHEDIH